MQYRHAQNRNFEDYASGRVTYNQPGQPAFPVRLASEIFQRSLAYWQTDDDRSICTLYDPVCGGAYWLTVLAYLHWENIASIYASDIDSEVLPLVERNLSLLTHTGIDQRIDEIKTMIAAYKKESHAGALASARKLREQLHMNLRSHAIKTIIFQADCADPESIHTGLGGQQIDLVLADVPYGWHSQWGIGNEELGMNRTPIWRMLEALHKFLNAGAVVAVAADKGQKVTHKKYHRLERFQVGKRRVFLLRPQ